MDQTSSQLNLLIFQRKNSSMRFYSISFKITVTKILFCHTKLIVSFFQKAQKTVEIHLFLLKLFKIFKKRSIIVKSHALGIALQRIHYEWIKLTRNRPISRMSTESARGWIYYLLNIVLLGTENKFWYKYII